MAITPILHRVLVKPDKIEDRDLVYKRANAVGIITGEEREREQAAIDTGVVVSVGPTAFRDFGVADSPIKVGDHVVYAKYGGKAIVDPISDVKYVALNDEDVIAVLTTEGA